MKQNELDFRDRIQKSISAAEHERQEEIKHYREQGFIIPDDANPSEIMNIVYEKTPRSRIVFGDPVPPIREDDHDVQIQSAANEQINSGVGPWIKSLLSKTRRRTIDDRPTSDTREVVGEATHPQTKNRVSIQQAGRSTIGLDKRTRKLLDLDDGSLTSHVMMDEASGVSGYTWTGYNKPEVFYEDPLATQWAEEMHSIQPDGPKMPQTAEEKMTAINKGKRGKKAEEDANDNTESYMRSINPW
jgi:hypothetical protein